VQVTKREQRPCPLDSAQSTKRGKTKVIESHYSAYAFSRVGGVVQRSRRAWETTQKMPQAMLAHDDDDAQQGKWTRRHALLHKVCCAYLCLGTKQLTYIAPERELQKRANKYDNIRSAAADPPFALFILWPHATMSRMAFMLEKKECQKTTRQKKKKKDR
jgi:hypothetical protein